MCNVASSNIYGRAGYNLAKNAWIATLLAAGYAPIMKTLATVEGNRQEAHRQELKWIERYEPTGQLFNLTEHL